MLHIELHLASGDDLDVRSFDATESISSAFRVDVVARAREDALDLHALVGKAASLKFTDELGGRSWEGVCAQAAQTAVEPQGLSTYALRIVPKLWLLTQRTGHRIFQRQSIPEIAQKLLGEWGIAPKLLLTHAHPKLPMRVQYGESDFHFLRRLFAEAGVSFFHRTRADGTSEPVLADAPEKGEVSPPLPFRPDFEGAPASAPAVFGVRVQARIVPHRVTLADHDFRRPHFALTGTHTTAHASSGESGTMLEHYRFAPGHSLAGSTNGASEVVADGAGAFRHTDTHAGAQATVEAQGHAADRTQIGFRASTFDLAPGTVFSVVGHPHPEVSRGVAGAGKKLLVTHARIRCDLGAGQVHATGRAVSAEIPFRAAVSPETAASPDPFEPLRQAGKPRVQGVQSAIVTGPPSEPIHTDEHGRVTLHFPWDRESSPPHEPTSPWVRVSQAWAGAAYGVHTIPRVGNEVLVAFHGGDPDQPVVVGRVHNTASPTPHALPEHKARTTIRTNTAVSMGNPAGVPQTPPGATATPTAATGGVGLTGGVSAPTTPASWPSAAGANEITFDDTAGKELFYVQAERDLHKIVNRDELELTHGSRHIQVTGNLVISAGGNLSIVAGKDLVVKGGPKVLLNPTTPAPKPTQPKPLKGPPKKPPAPPATKGTNAAAEAAKFLYRYETDLQAAGITMHCDPSESCANFVSSMLARIGAISPGSRNVNVGDMSTMLQSSYHWKKVPLSAAKPGDVWIVNQPKPGEQHTGIVSSNDNGRITLIGSNNHPVDGNQQVNYDSGSANAGMADSYILAPP